MTVLVVLLSSAGSFHRPGDADGGLRGVSVTFAALAIGVPLGALVTPWAVRRWGIGRWVPTMLVITGAGLAAAALPFRAPPLVAAAFLLGFGGQAVKVSVDSAVQRTVDDEHRGLVFALYDVLFNVAFVAAVALTAWLAPLDGKSAGAGGVRRGDPRGRRPVVPTGDPARVRGRVRTTSPSPARPSRSDSGRSDHQAQQLGVAASSPIGPRSSRSSSRKR